MVVLSKLNILLLQSLGGYLTILFLKLYAYGLASELLCCLKGCAATHRKIKHRVTLGGVGLYQVFHQGYGFLGWVYLLLFTPILLLKANCFRVSSTSVCSFYVFRYSEFMVILIIISGFTRIRFTILKYWVIVQSRPVSFKYKYIFVYFHWAFFRCYCASTSAFLPNPAMLIAFNITRNKYRSKRLRCHKHNSPIRLNDPLQLLPHWLKRDDRIPLTRRCTVRRVSQHHIHASVRYFFHHLQAIAVVDRAAIILVVRFHHRLKYNHCRY
jgi:hypothetical protein